MEDHVTSTPTMDSTTKAQFTFYVTSQSEVRIKSLLIGGDGKCE